MSTPPPCCDSCGKVTKELTGLGRDQVEWLCIDCLEAAVVALGQKLRRLADQFSQWGRRN